MHVRVSLDCHGDADGGDGSNAASGQASFEMSSEVGMEEQCVGEKNCKTLYIKLQVRLAYMRGLPSTVADEALNPSTLSHPLSVRMLPRAKAPLYRYFTFAPRVDHAIDSKPAFFHNSNSDPGAQTPAMSNPANPI